LEFLRPKVFSSSFFAISSPDLFDLVLELVIGLQIWSSSLISK